MTILSSATLLLLATASTIHGFAPPQQFHSSRAGVTSGTSSVTRRHWIDPSSILVSLDDLTGAADAANAAADVVSTATAATANGNDLAEVVAASSSATTFEPTSTYSKASYYTTLALYVASFPGLWSQIKRSTKAKVKRKTYVSPGEAAKDGKPSRQQAGEIMAYMKANNYEVAEAGETITFRGLVARSTSQAFFLTFCTALGMASLALVLQIQFQDVSFPVIGTPNWFLLTLLSPYAGIYYWRSGDRVDDVQVKLSSSDDDMLNEITIEGNDEEIERMWRTLELQEKGMVKVEGIF